MPCRHVWDRSLVRSVTSAVILLKVSSLTAKAHKLAVRADICVSLHKLLLGGCATLPAGETALK